jgi:DNA-binding protein
MAEKIDKKSKPNKPKKKNQRRRFRVNTKTEGKRGTVFIGSEDPFLYFPDMMSYFDRPEIEEIKLKARGKSISNAVNVAEQFRNRFKNEIESEVKDVSIGTEDVPKKDKKGTFRMSFIEITLVPSKKDDDN